MEVFLFMKNKNAVAIRKMTIIALFTALAYAATMIFRINVSFLTFDAKDAFVCIASLILGPGAGAVVTLVVATIEQLTVGDTGIWGYIMNVFSTGTYCMVAGYIYSKRRSISGVALALSSAVVATVTVMILCNILIVPLYMEGADVKMVIQILPTLLLPFNLTKTLLNSGIVLAIYKPLITALRSAKLLPKREGEAGDEAKKYWSVTTLIVLLVTVVIISASILYLIFGLGGTIQFNK